MGLKRYEISAFAKPGAESRHNTGYWIGRPFLGVWPFRLQLLGGKAIPKYRPSEPLQPTLLQEGRFPIDFEEKLRSEAHRREFFVIQLRMWQGVSLETFTKEHGVMTK